MSKNIFSNEAFADWCDQQGDRNYNYLGLFSSCAIKQYFLEKGVQVRSVAGHTWKDKQWIKHQLPPAWVRPTSTRPWNFKALAQRLRDEVN